MPGKQGYLGCAHSILLVTHIFLFHFRGLYYILGITNVEFCDLRVEKK